MSGETNSRVMSSHRSLRLFVMVLVIAGPLEAFSWDGGAWKKMGAALARRDATVNMLNGSFPIRLLADPSTPDWSRQIVDATQLLLPEMERIYGRSLTWETVFILAEKDIPASQWTYFNEVHIKQGAELISLAHGLAHLWVAGYQLAPAWAQEGIAHWVAIDALRKAGYADLARTAFNDAVRSFQTGFTQMDGPLPSLAIRGGVEDQYRYGLAKATAFVTVLRAAMGSHVFELFIQRLATVTTPLDSEGIRNLYDEVSGQSGDGLFQGWAASGSYQVYSANSFDDADGDGLAEVMEAAIGTHPKTEDGDNDGLSDGYEYWHNLNPMARSSDGTHEDLVQVGIAVDGLAADWESRSVPAIYEDALDDGNGADLEKVFAALDGDHFCLMVQFHGRLPVPSTTTVYVGITGTGTNRVTTTLGNTLDGSRNWVVTTRKGQPPLSRNTPERPARALKVYETCVETVDFTGLKEVKVHVSIHDDRSESNLDDMGGWWAPVELANIRVK